MKTFLFVLLCGLATVSVSGQKSAFQAPEYRRIEAATNDSNSSYFYPVLMNRYQKGDTTLSLKDYQMLYYGFLSSHDYTPRQFASVPDSIQKLLKKDALSKEEYGALIAYEKECLRKFPFNPDDLLRLSEALSKTGDTEESLRYKKQYEMVMETILSSGDGLTEKTAWHVIAINHEYGLLKALGYRFGGQQTLTDSNCDYLEVGENKAGIKGFYFDISQTLRLPVDTVPDNEAEPLNIIDGVAQYSRNGDDVDMSLVAGVDIDKKEIADCKGTLHFSGIIRFTTNEQTHKGLKYIHKQTHNWIVTHPFAEYELDGVAVGKDPSLQQKLFDLQPGTIKKIEIIEPSRNGESCTDGVIKIITKH
ncbi:MAG: DUF4919 domain-containing protein [Bacteroidota bacterium]|nr:DUF4919 domain-containing protein [Bacteroidota bacterium]